MDLIALVPRMLLHQLLSPWLFVPAIAVGWFARTPTQVVVGALAIGLASIAFVLLSGIPEGASLIYALMPLVFVSPLAWAFATRAVKRRLGHEPGEGSRRKVLRGLLGAAIGAPAGGVLGGLIGALAADLLEISSFEGESGYFVVFLFVLPGIVVGAIAGAVLLVRRR